MDAASSGFVSSIRTISEGFSMKLKTVAQVTNDLNAIAKQHGKSG